MIGTTVGCALIITDLSQYLTKKPWAVKHTGENTRRHPVYRACVIFWFVSPLYILFTEVSPVWLGLVVSALAAAVIPVLTPALIKLTSDKNLMGKFKGDCPILQIWEENLSNFKKKPLSMFKNIKNLRPVASKHFQTIQKGSKPR